MKDLAIYGAGGFGKEIACMIRKINEIEPTWNLVGFYDRIYEKGYNNGYGIVLGAIDEINAIEKDISLVIAVGDTAVVKLVVESIHNPRVSYPNIIHPSLYKLDESRFSIGRGNIIQRNCTVSCDVTMGDFNVLNGSVVLGHDVKVGNFNSFMPAVRISGEVTIGDCNFFGVSSIVLQQIRITNNVKLGAGSVLMQKPKEGNLYIGVPAKKIEL